MNDLGLLQKNLVKKGYDVNIFDTAEQAADFINSKLDARTIGIGGSVSVRQLGIFEMLSKHNSVCWHDEKPKDMTIQQARKVASQSDVYISSVNGISLNGEIVNIDNTGNRVAAISFGPTDVYFVVGKNKITQDLSSAVERTRNVAAPLNAKRLNRKTPCAIKGDRCYDCNSPDRICRNLSILLCKPTGANYHIVLVNENLGY